MTPKRILNPNIVNNVDSNVFMINYLLGVKI
jgi:hypothetical protein